MGLTQKVTIVVQTTDSISELCFASSSKSNFLASPLHSTLEGLIEPGSGTKALLPIGLNSRALKAIARTLTRS